MKFGVGDRVAVYSGSRKTGVIKMIDGPKNLVVLIDGETQATYAFFPQQCRKLVRRREFWVNDYGGSEMHVYRTLNGAIAFGKQGAKPIHVREVKEKKK